jgi:hypothetical protein
MEKYKKIMQDELHAKQASLEKAAVRVSELGGMASMTLGESHRRQLLAAASQVVVSTLTHDEVKEELNRLYQNATVIYKTKRLALIRLGDLLCLASKFGVTVYNLPLLGWPLKSFQFSQHSMLDAKALLDIIGAVIDGRDRSDSVFNYSACVVRAG